MNDTKRKAPREELGGWRCNSCTEWNTHNVDTCARCATRRPPDLDAVRVCIQAADEYIKALHDFRTLSLDVTNRYRIAAAAKLQDRGRLYEAARRRVLEQVLTPRT